eukprot:scaffold136618_cov133-Phaeocystis_antarctica.AAC.1
MWRAKLTSGDNGRDWSFSNRKPRKGKICPQLSRVTDPNPPPTVVLLRLLYSRQPSINIDARKSPQ